MYTNEPGQHWYSFIRRFNSLSPSGCGFYFKCVGFKRVVVITLLAFQVLLHYGEWCRTLLMIGQQLLKPPGNMPLPEPMLT